MADTRLKAPKHLSTTMKRWWTEIIDTYDMNSLDLHRLQAASEAWDRMEGARQVIASEGAFYRDQNGNPRKHPAVAVEAESRTAFLRAAREIGIDGVAVPEIRPPVLKGRRR